MTLAVGSVAVLGLAVNWLAAALLAFTIFFYVAIYTMWLKRSTPQNIVIGGAAGAFPPMIGWAAATGGIGARVDPAVPHHLLLDAAAFLGAVAVARRRLRARRRADAAGGRRRGRDAAADPDLCAGAGAARRRRRGSLGYSGALYGVTCRSSPAPASSALAVRVAARASGRRRRRKQLFAFSILYLFVLFAVLLADDRLGRLLGRSL